MAALTDAGNDPHCRPRFPYWDICIAYQLYMQVDGSFDGLVALCPTLGTRLQNNPTAKI